MGTGDLFYLALSPQHHIALRCHWELATLGCDRFSQRFKESLQLHNTLFPEGDGSQALYALCESTQCQLLTLSATTHGGQLLSYVVFAQTDGQGPPLLLFQGVHPALQRSGIGRWGLQLVYERCGRTRDLLVKIHEGRMDFYVHMGFVPKATMDNSRFTNVGRGMMRRAAIQGAPLGLTLAQAVSNVHQELRLEHKWIHSESLGFTIPVGPDSCFALTAIHLLASVPQFVEFFSDYVGASTDTGTTVSHCLAHLWANDQNPDGPAMVELLRGRLAARYGHSVPSRKRRAGTTVQGFMGQQDVEEILAAIQREITEDRPGNGGEFEHASTVEKGRIYTALITSEMIVASRCPACRSCVHTPETHSTFTVPLSGSPIRGVAQLLSPVLTLEWDRGRQAGCAADCGGGVMQGTVHFREAAPILHFQIMPGDAAGTRHRTQVDLPLRLKLRLDGEIERLYILRAVSFHSHSVSCFSGHFSVGRIVGRTLHHCSQLPTGAELTTHLVTDRRYFRLEELRPRLRKDYIVSSIFYSEVQLDERVTDTELWWDVWTQWAEHQLPDERVGDAALHAGTTVRPRRSIVARKELREVLADLVPPGHCLQVGRGEESMDNHLTLVRLALSQAEGSATPCFFWYQLPGQLVGAAMQDLAQDQDGLSLMRTSTATTGRGSIMTLQKVLQIIESEQPGDPFTSVHARVGGIGSLCGGTTIMDNIAIGLGLEVTGGCSLLASGCDAISKLHFHSLPVLNIYLALAFWDNKKMGASFEYPEAQRVAAGGKEYFFFDCFSLEEAGIRCFDVAEVQDLASLIRRIGQLPTAQRLGIRWYAGTMDGTSFNALYFPATMLHYVRTVATNASRRRWLYLGLATEVIPQDPKIREVIRSRLYQPAPMETSAAPVVHLRHLQQQSTTAFTWDLLQRLATRTQDKVTDYPSWHELQRLQAAQRDYALACDRVAAGDWNQVEQQLLSLLSSLQGGSAYVRRARELVGASQQAVSAYLLETGGERSARAEIATRSFAHRLDDVGQL